MSGPRPSRRRAAAPAPGPRIVPHVEALCADDPRLVFAGYALSWLTHLGDGFLALYYTVDRRLTKYGDIVVVADGRGRPASTLEAALRRYRQRFHSLDPYAPRRYSTGSVGVVDSTDLGPTHALAGSPYFSEYLYGLGMRRQTTLHLRQDGQITAGLDLLRPEDDAETDGLMLAFLRAGHPMIEHGHACAQATSPPAPDVFSIGADGLTPRQREIALLVVRGATNGEVARGLTISESTVKTHLLHIYEKLNVRSRTQLVAALGGAVRQDPGTPLNLGDDAPRTTSSPPPGW